MTAYRECLPNYANDSIKRKVSCQQRFYRLEFQSKKLDSISSGCTRLSYEPVTSIGVNFRKYERELRSRRSVCAALEHWKKENEIAYPWKYKALKTEKKAVLSVMRSFSTMYEIKYPSNDILTDRIITWCREPGSLLRSKRYLYSPELISI